MTREELNSKMPTKKDIKKMTKWLKSPEGIAHMKKEKKKIDAIIEAMKPRPFTWEELNTPMDF